MDLYELILTKIPEINSKYGLNGEHSDHFEEGILLLMGIDEKPTTSVMSPFVDGAIFHAVSAEELKQTKYLAISVGISNEAFAILLQRLAEQYPDLNPIQIESRKKEGYDSTGLLPTFVIDISSDSFKESFLPNLEKAIELLTQDEEKLACFLAQEKEHKQLAQVLTTSEDPLHLILMAMLKAREPQHSFEKTIIRDWYDDQKITIVTDEILKQKGYDLLDDCAFSRKVTDETREKSGYYEYIPAYTPPVSHQSALYYLDKEHQPQPKNPEEANLLRDVFDELAEPLMTTALCHIEIITACSWSNTHWTTIQVSIIRTNNNIEIKLYNHNPKTGCGKMPNNMETSYKQSLEQKLTRLLPDCTINFVSYDNEPYPYVTRQDTKDIKNCGPIHCEDAARLIDLQPLHPACYTEEECQRIREQHNTLIPETAVTKIPEVLMDVTPDASTMAETQTTPMAVIPNDGTTGLMFQQCLIAPDYEGDMKEFIEMGDNRTILSPLSIFAGIKTLIYARELNHVTERLLLLSELGLLNKLRDTHPTLTHDFLTTIAFVMSMKPSQEKNNCVERIIISYFLIGDACLTTHKYKDASQPEYKAHQAFRSCFRRAAAGNSGGGFVVMPAGSSNSISKEEGKIAELMLPKNIFPLGLHFGDTKAIAHNLVIKCLEKKYMYVRTITQLLEVSTPTPPDALREVIKGRGVTLEMGPGFTIGTSNKKESFIKLETIKKNKLPLLHYYAHEGKVGIVRFLLTCTDIDSASKFLVPTGDQELTAVEYASQSRGLHGINSSAMECIKLICEKTDETPPAEESTASASLFKAKEPSMAFKLAAVLLKKKVTTGNVKIFAKKIQSEDAKDFVAYIRSLSNADQLLVKLSEIAQKLEPGALQEALIQELQQANAVTKMEIC